MLTQTGIDRPTEVLPGLLWLSGSRQPFPPLDLDLDVVVCQPREAWHSPGARRTVALPLTDVTLADADPAAVLALARDVAAAVRHRERVLVRCHWGLERSAVVVSMALRLAMPTCDLGVIVRSLRLMRSPLVLEEGSTALRFLREHSP